MRGYRRKYIEDKLSDYLKREKSNIERYKERLSLKEKGGKKKIEKK